MAYNPIRVAHVVGKMVGGGVEAFLMNYYRNIDRTQIQFDFIVDSDSTVVPEDEIEALGGRIFYISPYQNILLYIKELRKIFRDNRYRIVHSHLNVLSVFPLYCAWMERVPVRIAHSHSTSNKIEWKKNIIKTILRPFSKLFATNYFACSIHAGKWLFGNGEYNKGNIELIKNAIDINKFKFNSVIRDRVRKELEIDKNTLVYGHVGRFVQQKNHMFLIKVFRKIYEDNKNSVLLLIGDGPLEEQVRLEVKKYDMEKNIKFLGIRNNVEDYMSAMDVFLFPSIYEGLGIVLVEAQAAGLKCFCSSCIPQEVKFDDLCFIDKFDEDEWFDKIKNCEFKSREYSDKKILMHGYDIKEASSILEKKYFELFEV